MSAVTQNDYTGNGSTTNYSFTFPYLKASDIKVSLDAVATTAFTLANATTIQFNTAPGNGVKIKIFRETSVDNLTATFYAGSAIKSEDLNDNFTQNLYVTQEVNGRYLSTLGGTMTGNFNLGEDADITFEGATDDAHETTLTVVDPTADRTITLPNVTGTVVTTGDTGTVATGMIADDAVTMDKLNSGALPTDITVASANIVDGTIVNADVNAAAAIDGTKVNPAFGSQNITTTGTAATGAQTVTGNIAVSGTVDGRDVAADGTKLDGIETAATADQTAAEIRTLVESATDSNVFTDADHTKLNGVDTGATDDQTASEIKTLIASSPLDSSHLAANSVTTSEIADAELTTLAGMQSGTASKLADSTALTADIADLNQIDGLTKQTTISDTDTSFPTSGAVVDYVTGQIDEIGGFEAITNEVSFPNTQPGAGVAISIADAAGIVVSGSGSSTTGRTVGGSTVTINNFPSSLNSETLAAGVGLMVSSTGSSQTYNYHKLLAAETDVKQLSDDINDFISRYRVGSSNPTSSLDSGDLFFNTGTGKLLVYNGVTSQWEETQTVGNFFINTLSSSSGTGGGSATFNGSAYRFTLSNAGTFVQQHLVSVNGVIQKPNTGTSQPSEGFALDGGDIIFSAAPASGADFFIITIGSSVSIGTPTDGTVSTAKLASGAVTTAKIADSAVNSAKIADGAIVNADVNASAAIAGTKIAPNFGSQNVVTTGTLGSGDFTVTSTEPTITFTDSDTNPDFKLRGVNGGFRITDITNGADRLVVNTDGHVDVTGNLDVGAGLDVTGAITSTGNLAITRNQPIISFDDSSDNPDYYIGNIDGAFIIRDTSNSVTRFQVNTDGHVDIAGNLDCASGIDVTGNISVTGTVDGIDIATDVAANTAKTSNATHTGDVTGSTSLTIASGAVTTAKIADDAVNSAKIADGAINSASMLSDNLIQEGKIQNSAIATAKIADQAVTLAKLPHGTSSNNGKFLRANNGADPTFETVTGTTINNNAANTLITGSGTANTLSANSLFKVSGGYIHLNQDNGGISFGTAGVGSFGTTPTIARAQQSGYHISTSGAGDLCIGAEFQNDILFGTTSSSSGGLTGRLKITAAGHTTPASNNAHDLGDSSTRWRNIYTNDLNLSNEGSSNDIDNTWGNWTIQEGESDLFLKNNRSGKKYKFNLTEVL